MSPLTCQCPSSPLRPCKTHPNGSIKEYAPVIIPLAVTAIAVLGSLLSSYLK